MSNLEQDLRECGFGREDFQEGEKLEPIQEIELNLRNALIQLKLGYTITPRRLIEEAINIIERKL